MGTTDGRVPYAFIWPPSESLPIIPPSLSLPNLRITVIIASLTLDSRRRRRINKPTTSDRAEKEMTAIYRAIVVYGPAASCPVIPGGKRVVS